MLDLNALPLPQLFSELTADGCLDRLLTAAFAEDARAPGDITTMSIIEPRQTAKARVVARQAGVLAGLATIPRIFAERSPRNEITCNCLAQDGQPCRPGQILVELNGNLRAMLLHERVLLNLIGRLSGVASLTRQYVEAVNGSRAIICDTRKTTPGLRNLEKYAVRCGGGTLHRLGLFDAALYKDNHLAGLRPGELAKTLERAVGLVRSQHEVRFVEVEVDSLEQFREVLGLKTGLINMILLDNMNSDQLQQAVAIRDATAPGILLEASGGVTLKTVRAIAQSGVDRIAVGAMTHSAPFLDVALDIDE